MGIRVQCSRAGECWLASGTAVPACARGGGRYVARVSMEAISIRYMYIMIVSLARIKSVIDSVCSGKEGVFGVNLMTDNINIYYR